MPLNSFTLGCSLGELPEFCGPSDLADIVIAVRREEGDPNRWNSPLSDNAIRKLIMLGYYSSLAPEEGRYPRFRIVGRDRKTKGPWSVMSFTKVLDSVDTLRRLAPAVSEPDTSLLITEEENGTLVCSGVVISGDAIFDTIVGRPEIPQGCDAPEFSLKIDGPGCVRASEQLFTFKLEGGRIRQVVEFNVVEQIRDLWEMTSSALMEDAVAVVGERAREYFGGRLNELVHRVWSQVLSVTIENRHGGAFVILPTNERVNPEDYDIDCKYRTEFSLGVEVTDFWNACVNAVDTTRDTPEYDNAIHAWRWRRNGLFTRARALGNLSGVDGCVLLNRRLDILGFGGVIRVDGSNSNSATRSLRNIKTGELTPESELNRMGTRHRSAYRFC